MKKYVSVVDYLNDNKEDIVKMLDEMCQKWK